MERAVKMDNARAKYLALLLPLLGCDEGSSSQPTPRSISGDTVFNVLDYGAVGDCDSDPMKMTEEHVDIQAAIVAAEAVGGSVFFPEPPGGCYFINKKLEVSGSVSLWGRSRPEIRISADDQPALEIVADDVSVTNLALTHPTPSDTVVGNSDGILVPWDGTTSARFDNIQIRDVYVEGFHDAGIRVEHADGVRVEGSEVKDVSYAGIMVLDVKNATLDGNRVEDLFNDTTGSIGPDRVYGIYSTRVLESGTVDEASRDVAIHHNRVRDADIWHCYDTHGGQRNSFVANLCLGSTRGVAVGSADGPTEADRPGDTLVAQNILVSNQTAGTAYSAVDLTASNSATQATGLLAGSNVARGYGEVDPPNGENAGMQSHTTDGLLFHANNLVGVYGRGIAAMYKNTDISVVANVVTGLKGEWDRPSAFAAKQDNPVSGVDSNDGLIAGNRAGQFVAVQGSTYRVVTLESGGNEFSLGLNSSTSLTDPLLIITGGGTAGSSGHQANDTVIGQGLKDPTVLLDGFTGAASITICDGGSGSEGDICLNPGAGAALQVYEGGMWVGK